MRRLLVVSAVLLGLAGCAGRDAEEERAPLTGREHDSVLAEQPLPGASAVGGALEASDRAATDAARVDAAIDSLPR